MKKRGNMEDVIIKVQYTDSKGEPKTTTLHKHFNDVGSIEEEIKYIKSIPGVTEVTN